MDTKDYPILNIEFPGITICPNTKIMKSNFRVAMASSHLPWKNLTNTRGPAYQYKLLTYLNNMVKFSVDPRSLVKIDDSELDGILNDMKGDVAKLMGMVAPSCKRMMLICRWQGEYRNCSEMFKVTKTDNGFCCSFNTISVSEGFAKAPEDESADEEPAEYDYAFYDPDFGFFDPAGPALPWEASGEDTDSSGSDDNTGLDSNDDTGSGSNSNDDTGSGSNSDDDSGSGSNSNDDSGSGSNSNNDAGSGSDNNDDTGAGSDSNDDAGSGSDSNDDAGSGSDSNDDAGAGSGSDTGDPNTAPLNAPEQVSQALDQVSQVVDAHESW